MNQMEFILRFLYFLIIFVVYIYILKTKKNCIWLKLCIKKLAIIKFKKNLTILESASYLIIIFISLNF